MLNNISRNAFIVGASIGLFGALTHWAAPLIGPDWYAFLHSPASVVTSARTGSWLAPSGAVVIGALMFLCAVYAFSGAGIIRRIPLLRTALVVITAICVLRGLALVPVLVLLPGRASGFDIIASLVWLLAGLSFLLGTVGSWRRLRQHRG